MRFVCELGATEHLVEAEKPEDAARQVARRQAAHEGVAAGESFTCTVIVAEANEADLPLIAGDEYRVTI